ncbi:beta-mannosidase [Flavobacterium humi]|uniref:Beta-mannosidase n=1 Tax=Flavobacterium humi TaxID=2562683 RepID=A0A4Z0L4U4_9FLAO|nr:glycoside hydrolase family 2 protein [Flavobacterium humi]TGD57388.1 glycoside hydrolase family 2 protein [Flavobacterium humi]
MGNILKYIVFFLWPVTLLAQTAERKLNAENWHFKKTEDKNWLPATVPGTVHTDLWNNKVIPDPFWGTNEKQLLGIENENWEYESVFTVTGQELKHETIELQFDGLDTYAKVYLNNELVLEADNMFRTWKIDVKNTLKKGKNKLYILFEPAVKKGKEEAQKLPYVLPGDEKVFTRKAQYQYGWDWGPRFVTAGIWKDVKLVSWDAAVITNVKYFQKKLSDEKAELEFVAEIQSNKKDVFQLKINNESKTIALKKGTNNIAMSYVIANPKRWWSNGLGEAYLYPFSISLSRNATVFSKKQMHIGLRTLELIQEKDKSGKSFYFKLNGIPVFMKGANYIPPDSFLPRVKDSVYQSIVSNAANAHMNMLRVWGGGVYADDAFYEECDKKGILVWQDFMFACAMYPDDAHFVANVKKEVADNVKRLQNHPSIAIWCGNNESDEGWKNWGWQKQYHYSQTDSASIWNGYKKLFHEAIPQTLDSLLGAGKNIYWPSSPSIGWGRKESLLEGDSHYWGVWWGMQPFEVYMEKTGRFMSEYGFQGMPNLETFQEFAPEEELNFASEAVKNHQKHPTGYQTIQTYMERDYKIPTKFDDYIYVSQLLQAEGMKTAMEAHRRAKPYCMGSLFWQLNDCWPVTSWSAADYYGRWKAFQYQAKRSFEPVLVSVQEEKDSYEIFIVNDELTSKKGTLELQLMDFEGKTLWHKSATIHIEENSSKIYETVTKTQLAGFNLKETVLRVQLTMPGAEEKEVLYYFEKPKNLALKKPVVSVTYTDANTIEITTDILAKNIFITAGDAFFSDNYFDLLPGRKKKIVISNTEKGKALSIKTLFDTLP